MSVVIADETLNAANKPVLDDLRILAGFRVSDKLYARVLQTAEE